MKKKKKKTFVVGWRCIERVRIYEVKSNPADLGIAAASVGLCVHQSTF